MLTKTTGIVLTHLKYKESSIIVNIYTRELGLQSYVINGVRSARSKSNKIALFQPLTLLDLVVYHKEKSSLQRISESKCALPYHSIPIHTHKATIALFLVEVLSKTLKEQESNIPLFNFLWESLVYFDQAQQGIENFHLIFLIRLSQFLGFAPESFEEINTQLRGVGIISQVTGEEQLILNQLLQGNFEDQFALSGARRHKLLQVLLQFYDWHVDRFLPIKSLSVLNQVFS